MEENKFQMITYNGNQISMISDGKDDYVNITEMAKAWKYRKSIMKWIVNRQTLDFLSVWEKKHNSNFDGTQMGTIKEQVKDRNFSLSIGYWIEKTNAIGFFTNKNGTYAAKDIAIKFAAWLSPEFELYLIEEIQKLKDLERQKNSFDLLNHDQILALVRLKEVFKYVAHQEMIEDAHKEVFAARSGSKNPFAEFNTWRNEILNISPDVINERIKRYCIENNIALTKRMLNKTKREKNLILDTYEAVRNAVWDFLKIRGEVNALNLANLVGDMIRTEKGEIFRKNETDLFKEKQELGEYSDFEKQIGDMKEVKSARQLLQLREEIKKRRESPQLFNQHLKALLSVPPPNKDNK